MKQFSLIFCFVLAGYLNAQAGWDLRFCTNDSAGHCLGKGELFTWNGEATEVFAMVNNPAGMDVAKIQFKVLDMKNDHNGEVYAELRSYVRPEWTSVTKKLYFVKPGYYKIEVYDQSMARLTEAYVTVSERIEE